MWGRQRRNSSTTWSHRQTTWNHKCKGDKPLLFTSGYSCLPHKQHLLEQWCCREYVEIAVSCNFHKLFDLNPQHPYFECVWHCVAVWWYMFEWTSGMPMIQKTKVTRQVCLIYSPHMDSKMTWCTMWFYSHRFFRMTVALLLIKVELPELMENVYFSRTICCFNYLSV